MGKFAVALLCLVAISGCKEKLPTERVSREFPSMQQCLLYIADDIGDRLKVMSDKPGDVSGKSEVNGFFFRCELRMTGTRGAVLEGRWDRRLLNRQ